MFRFTRKPSSGSYNQYLAKITHLVKSGYVELVQDVISVMAAYCDLTVELVQDLSVMAAYCDLTVELVQDVSVMAAYCDLTGHSMQP